MPVRDLHPRDVNHLLTLLAGKCQIGRHAKGLFHWLSGLHGFNLVTKSSSAAIEIVECEREVLCLGLIGCALYRVAAGVERIDGA